MKIKRFVVFHGDCYYPGGGFDDYHSSYDTKDEAMAAANNIEDGEWTWTQIIDLENFTKI